MAFNARITTTVGSGACPGEHTSYSDSSRPRISCDAGASNTHIAKRQTVRRLMLHIENVAIQLCMIHAAAEPFCKPSTQFLPTRDAFDLTSIDAYPLRGIKITGVNLSGTTSIEHHSGAGKLTFRFQPVAVIPSLLARKEEARSLDGM